MIMIIIIYSTIPSLSAVLGCLNRDTNEEAPERKYHKQHKKIRYK